MKKTYWWRIILLMVSIIAILISYILVNQIKFGICDEIYLFGNSMGCLDESSKTIGQPLFVVALTILVLSIVFFFISDLVFKKWLRFAIAWIALTFIFVFLSPVSSTQVIGNPTKESVSIWMSSLFVIISFIQLVVLSKKQKKG